jgi:hypothetical protein
VLLIFFGSRWREFDVETSPNVCPTCQDETLFVITENQKYFTLFFIPLFSYGKILETAKCTQCGMRFEVDK